MAIIALTTLLYINTLAQRANMVWGDEFKLRKGSTDLQIIFADKSGVYMKEAHFLKEKYIHSTYTTSESATLIKLDKGLTELYRNKFDKELKGKEYEDFFFLKNKLFLLASDYDKKSSKYIVYAAEVDKNSGELVDKLTAIASWDKHEKEESVFKAVHNHDSSKMVLVCAIEGREKSSYQICQLNEQLQTTEPPISISNEYDAKTFQLEDVVYAQNGHIVLVSREYEYEEGRKEKKDKFLHFKNYSVRICDGQGRLVKNINTSIEGKWVMSVKVMQMQNKELILAAFYGDEKRGSEVNGIFIQRVDATSGDIISSSQKELNTGMVEDLADEKKTDNGKDGQATTTSENKQDGGEGFSRFLRFRSFISTSDNGVVILAEKHRTYISKYVSTNPSNGNSVVFNFLMYECGDIFMCKMNATGNIDWLHIMPKLQREPLYFKSLPKPASVGVGTSFFKTRFNLPFYASFGLLQTNNTLSLIFNDEPRNSSVLQTVQKPYAARNLNVSDCFAIHLNMLTGQYTRSVLFSNIDVPTAMPRFSRLLGNQLYMIGKQERVMAKTKFIIGRLTIK